MNVITDELQTVNTYLIHFISFCFIFYMHVFILISFIYLYSLL